MSERRGHGPEEAQDLTQDFFAYLLERDLIAKADPSAAASARSCAPFTRRQIAAHYERKTPSNGEVVEPICRSTRSMPNAATRAEPTEEVTPERIFDRTWALTLLGRVVERLRREYDDAGRAAIFEELVTVLTRGSGADPYVEIAHRLRTTEGNVRVAVHRLRRRYGLLLREEIAATIDDASQIDDEIRSLFAALEG